MKPDRRPRDSHGQVKCATHHCATRINPRTSNGVIRQFCDGCEHGKMVEENITAAEVNVYKDRLRTGRRPK